MHLRDSHHQLALYTLSHVILQEDYTQDTQDYTQEVSLPGHFTDEGSQDTKMVENLPQVLR